jgi:signal transduction histidine kinase
VERIKGTVQQLLNIGRREPLILQHGDVDGMIRECLELTCIGRRNIEVDLQLGIGRPLWVGMEALRQVMINLTGNAVQALGENGGRLYVCSSLCEERLTISLADNGPGIAPEHLDKIFEPFFTTKEVGE